MLQTAPSYTIEYLCRYAPTWREIVDAGGRPIVSAYLADARQLADQARQLHGRPARVLDQNGQIVYRTP